MVTTWTTLRASLSGIFLQTLSDLVTPLKGYSLSPHGCPPTRSAPSERFGYYDCRRNLAPMRSRRHEAHPPRVKKERKKRVPSRFKRFWFYMSWRKQHGQLDIIWVVCNKRITVWAPTKNCLLADSFLDSMAELNTAVVEGRMSYTSAWSLGHFLWQWDSKNTKQKKTQKAWTGFNVRLSHEFRSPWWSSRFT